MRRVLAVSVSAPIARAFSATPLRQVKSTDPTYEDDRWLEAQFAAKEKTPEERYAAQKQMEIMKSMMGRMREQTATTVSAAVNKERESAAAKEAERDAKIAELNAQIGKLMETLSEIKK